MGILLSNVSDGYGDGYGVSYGYGPGPGYGYGYGDSDGYGDGYGYGYGYGDGDGDGYGDGYGDGGGDGGHSYGYGSGDGDMIGVVAGHEVRHIPAFGVLSVGCECHTIKTWRRSWGAIAARHGIEVDRSAVDAMLVKVERATARENTD